MRRARWTRSRSPAAAPLRRRRRRRSSAPLALTVDLPGYDLRRLRGFRPTYDKVAVTLRGRVTVGGRLHAPTAEGALEIAGFTDGKLVFDAFKLSGSGDRSGMKLDVNTAQH